MSRYGRILPGHGGYYAHVMSRVVDRRFILGAREKEYFRDLMYKLARFSGLEVVTYALLDNHFHMLLYVSKREDLNDNQILGRLSHIQDKQQVGEVRQRLKRFSGYETKTAWHEERAKHLNRMYNLGQYMKALKQQFTRWYNPRYDRKGTLWEARYKSVVVEGAGHPLLTMATYIDLNPIRAGLCEDPKDYRWCGYGAALGGEKEARAGLTRIAVAEERSTDWRMVRRMYSLALSCSGVERGGKKDGGAIRKGLKREQAVKIWENGGFLSRAELLRCRVRYLTDGVALGSREFVETLFEEKRDRFGEKRKTGSRSLKGAGWDGLCSMRDLQVSVVT